MSTIGRFPKLVAVTALALFGCSGQVDNSGRPTDPGNGTDPGSGGGGKTPPGGGGVTPPGGGGVTPPGGGGTTTPPGPGAPGTAVFRRLNRVEYNNTIRDLLGDNSNPAKDFPPDADSAKSGFFAGGTVALADAGHLLEATEAIADGALKRLKDILPCSATATAAADQDQCARTFITSFGKRAFRRPLTPEETTDLTSYYGSLRSGGNDFQGAVRLLLAGILLSPQFLYRWEVTPKTAVKEGALVRYNSYEMASRLSYLLWASMPDDASFGLADQNKLSTPDQIEAEARRMLKDPKAKQALADFFTQWLAISDLHNVAKDSKAFPTFTAELADSMVAETAAFGSTIVVDGDGKLSTVFTSSNSFVDANLGKLYGVSATGTTLAPMALKAGERAGILTTAGWLTQHASAEETNPPRRGKLLADRVVCAEIPLPPDNVPDPKPPAPNLSVRERFEDHSKNPCASACHNVIDPLGFAFENYNGIGAYQTTDGMKPVNASGSISLDGAAKPFKNGIEFQALLGQSKQVADCMARQFLRYALKRKEVSGDEPALAAALETFNKQSGNLRELIVALTRTRAFTHRTPTQGEVLQ
jgi:hypothetical protein